MRDKAIGETVNTFIYKNWFSLYVKGNDSFYYFDEGNFQFVSVSNVQIVLWCRLFLLVSLRKYNIFLPRHYRIPLTLPRIYLQVEGLGVSSALILDFKYRIYY